MNILKNIQMLSTKIQILTLTLFGGLESRELVMSEKGASSFCIWWRDLCKHFLGSNGEGMSGEFVKKIGR